VQGLHTTSKGAEVAGQDGIERRWWDDDEGKLSVAMKLQWMSILAWNVSGLLHHDKAVAVARMRKIFDNWVC